MNEHKCEKCEHEKECLNMVCFYELLEKEEGKIRADERAKVLEEFKEKMRNLNQLNCFVDYVADEIDLEELMNYASEEIAEQLKEQTGEGREVD